MPEGRVDVVIVSGGTVTTSGIVADAVFAGLWLSVTVAVRLNDPVAVGVPEMTPLPARVSPTGSPETDQM